MCANGLGDIYIYICICVKFRNPDYVGQPLRFGWMSISILLGRSVALQQREFPKRCNCRTAHGVIKRRRISPKTCRTRSSCRKNTRSLILLYMVTILKVIVQTQRKEQFSCQPSLKIFDTGSKVHGQDNTSYASDSHKIRNFGTTTQKIIISALYSNLLMFYRVSPGKMDTSNIFIITFIYIYTYIYSGMNIEIFIAT